MWLVTILRSGENQYKPQQEVPPLLLDLDKQTSWYLIF
jgi:hypothetical protein